MRILDRWVYPINRPLKAHEKQHQLDPKIPIEGVKPWDWLSLIKMNSTYMELVDNGYHDKSPMLIWYIFASSIIVFSTFYFGYSFLLDGDFSLVEIFIEMVFFIIGFVFSLFLLWIVSLQVFKKTHYPIRLNRKTRKVYQIKAKDEVLEANWDDLYFFVQHGGAKTPFEVMDIRAHILNENRETVLGTFVLMSVEFANQRNIHEAWEYIRSYMEDADGVEKAYNNRELCLPIDGRREGALFAIFRTYMFNIPIMQFLMAIQPTIEVLGRCLSIYTSKIPVWPKRVEDACLVDPDDPYQCNWRDNRKFTFGELGWPIICTVFGLLQIAAVVGWLLFRTVLS